MDDLKKKGFTAFIWDFFGKLAKQGTGFVVTIFLARLLEPADFGLVAIIMVVIGIAGVFTDIGLGAALIQRRRVHPVHFSSVFYFNISVGLFLSAATFFAAPGMSRFYGNEQLLPLVQVMSVSFVLNAFSSVQRIRLRKELNYALLTKIGFVSSLVSGVTGVGLAFWGAGVWSLVVQSLSMGFISNIILWRMARWRPSLVFSWKALTQLWGFGFRMFLSNILETVFTRIDYMIIGKLFPMDILGFYQRAKSLNLLVINYSSGSLMSVLFPVLSKIQQDLPRFQTVVIKALGIISFSVFFLLGNLYLVSEELMVLLFSDKWLPAAEYFQILALSGFSYPINSLLVNTIVSRGNSALNLKIQIYKKLVLLSNLSIGFFFGLTGYLYGLVVVAVVNTLINVAAASHEIKLSILTLGKPVVLQAILTMPIVYMTLVLAEFLPLSDILRMIIKILLFSLAYIMVNHIFKIAAYLRFFEQVEPIVKKMAQRLKKR